MPSLNVGDWVVVEVIESDCGHFGWRAVSISLDASLPVEKVRFKLIRVVIFSRFKAIQGKGPSADSGVQRRRIHTKKTNSAKIKKP